METETSIFLGLTVFYVILFTLLGLYGTTFSDQQISAAVPTLNTYNATAVNIAAPAEDTSWNIFGWFTVVVNILNFFIRVIITVFNLFLYLLNFMFAIINVIAILPPILNTIIFLPLVMIIGWIAVKFALSIVKGMA